MVVATQIQEEEARMGHRHTVAVVEILTEVVVDTLAVVAGVA
jgi:hypothetical protein